MKHVRELLLVLEDLTELLEYENAGRLLLTILHWLNTGEDRSILDSATEVTIYKMFRNAYERACDREW